MKTKIYLFSFAMLICSIGYMGCSRPGCDDVNACNYDADAKSNDGSCINKGQVTFWQNSTTDGHDIVVTVNATEATSTTQLQSTPLCDASGCATFALCPGSHNYTAREVLPGVRTWSGNVTSVEDGCITILLD
jgi:hypothetical protein